MRRFSTGRYIGQEELELWTLPGWFPALGKPGFPQMPHLRRLGVINRIPETDRLQIPMPERGPGPEAGITAGYAPVWGRRNRKPPTDSAEEAPFFRCGVDKSANTADNVNMLHTTAKQLFP